MRKGATISQEHLGRAARRPSARLAATEQELRARFDQSPIAQSRLDLTGRILALNPAMERLLGRSASALIGTNALTLFAERERDGAAESLAALGTGAVAHVAQERAVLLPDGAELQAVTTVTLIRDAAGEPRLAASVEDVTALRCAEQAVRDNSQLLDAFAESMPVAIFAYDLDGRCTVSRGQALGLLGLVDSDLVGELLCERFADTPELVGGVTASLAGEPATVVVDFADRTWEGQYRPLRDGSGRVVGGLGVALDVTSLVRPEREMRAHDQRLRALLRRSTELVLVLDRSGRLVYVSPAIVALFGYQDDVLTLRFGQDFNHPDDLRMIGSAWRSVLSAPGGTATLECRILHADGTWRWAEHILTNLIDDPAVGGVVLNVRETTDRRRAEAELRRMALQDALTGLANRGLLLDRVAQAFVRNQREARPCGIVVLDVVGMRGINEQFGHAGGDLVLCAVAERLTAVTRPTDSVARVGADEFAVLFEAAASAEELRAWTVVLLEAAQEPVRIGSVEVQVSLRAGFALTPAADAGALLTAAERAAEEGTRPAEVRQAVVGADQVADAGAIADLTRALERDELRLHYQPVIDLETDEVAGVEALVRWQHPERGLLPPSEFVPLAEGCGLITVLGEWVLREACRTAARWQRDRRGWSVSVNLSPRQLASASVVDVVQAILAETGAAAGSLILEVTESALIDDSSALETLHALRGLGLRLALDDFGTGYSSLTYLKRFPVDALKIDRSFVSGMGRDADDDAIVASVVSLGRAVGKAVVAEGVETAEQRAALVALGVAHAQGFLWSRALPPRDLERWVEARRPVTAHPAAATAVADSTVTGLAYGPDLERILQLHREGASLHTIAATLNAEGRRTAAGLRWHTRTVARVVAALPSPG